MGVITVDMVLCALDNRARGSVATHTAMIPKAGWNHLQSFVFFRYSHFLITKNASSASPFCHYKNPLSVHLEDRKQRGFKTSRWSFETNKNIYSFQTSIRILQEK